MINLSCQLPHGCSTRRGLSLFEILIALTIAGVIAAVAAPRYASSLARYRAMLAAKRIAADLAFAQDNARMASASCSVIFDKDNVTCRLDGVKDLSNSQGEYVVKFANSPYAVSFAAVDFAGDEVIVFNGYGVPDSGGSIIVRSGDVNKTVIVNAITGEATVQ